MPKAKADIKEDVESGTITFRIEKSMLEDLRQESEQTGISVNSLVNQIIKSYIQWHNPAKKAGIGHFSKIFHAKMINSFSEDQVIKLSEDFCKHNFPDISNMLRIESSFSLFIDKFCNRLDVSGFYYRFDSADNIDSYVIQFDMGRNWSLYMKTTMEFTFERYGVKNAKCKMTDNTLIIIFSKKNTDNQSIKDK
jgi:hypothetical protein